MALIPTSPGSSASQREAAQQDGFLREVDEALREEEFFTMLRRYGKPVGAAIVAGLLALGGYLWWQSHSQQQAAERAEKMTFALDKLDSGNLPGADKDLQALTTGGTPGSQALAALTRAGIAAQQGKAADAAKAYAAVAADASAPQPLRDLARVREVAVQFDTLPPQDVVTKLQPLAVPGNAWFGPAGELVSLAYLKENKPQLAGPLLAAIAKDKDVPESLRGRARQLAGQLGFDSVDDVNKVVGPQGSPAVAQ